MPAPAPDHGQRRLVLVSLDWTRPKDPRVPLGHASLVASVRADARVDLVERSYSVQDPEFRWDRVLDEALAATEGRHPAAVGSLPTTTTPADRISSRARDTSPECRSTPRQASSTSVVRNPSRTASSAVARTQ